MGLGTGGKTLRLAAFSCACLALVLGLAVAAFAQDTESGDAAGVSSSAAIPAWLKNMAGAAPSLQSAAQTSEAEALGDSEGDDPTPPGELRSLTPTAAAESASENFPGLIKEPISLALDLSPGEKIVRYLAPNIAQLTLSAGGHAVAESVFPMLTETPSGKTVPVNLELAENASTIEPVHPIVAVEIPKQLKEGVALPESGVALTPISESGQALSGAEGRIEGATAFFANTQTDTDTLAKPLPMGFETQTLLRSSASPEQLYFDISAGESSTLTELEDGSVAIEDADGNPVATVLPVIAVDAAGTPVPATMGVEDSRLVIGVSHRSDDYQYPIAVDPTVNDENSFNKEEKLNWVFYTPYPVSFVGEHSPVYCGCLKVWNWGGPYEYGQGAAWAYQTQGSSHIYELDSNVSSSGVNATNIVAIANSSEEWEAESNLGINFTSKATSICTAGGCATGGGSTENAAIYELVGISTGGNEAWGNLNSATVKISQESGPSASFDTTSKELGGKKNALYNSSPWLRSSDAAVVKYAAHDPGLGIKDRQIIAPATPTWSAGLAWGTSMSGRCVGVQCDQDYEVTVDVSKLPDGANTVEAVAKNPTGATKTITATVNIDNTQPHASTGLPNNGVIALGRVLHLKIKGADGKAPTASSGVKSTDVELDGELQWGFGTSLNCSPGPCETSSQSLNINSIGLSPGIHKLITITTDKAGNVSTEEAEFVVQSAPSEAIGPGQVNLASGEFSLAETDVSAEMAGAGLSVVRTYQSRGNTSGQPGALTGYWQLSLGGWRGIETLEDGSAVLSDPKGRAFLFKHMKEGGFSSPAGYEAWTLTYSGSKPATYTLTDASGNVTTFEKPGETGDVFVPSAFSGPGGTAETVFEFEKAYGGWGPRPKRAIGPTPKGVSCTEALVRGCRALSFEYASSTTATGDDPAEWGDRDKYLRSISLTAWDPETEEMSTVPMAQYAYDSHGALRAAWDPRISPELKTTYGYSGTNGLLLASVAPPGQQPWIMSYGYGSKESGGADWLLSVTQPKAAVALKPEIGAPYVINAPTISSRPEEGKSISVDIGSWGNNPLKYRYQWERCEEECCHTECSGIPGATHATYTPGTADVGHRLKVHITAINASGASEEYAVESAKVLEPWTEHYVPACKFSAGEFEEGSESEPTAVAVNSSGQYVWVLDAAGDRLEKYGPSESEAYDHTHNCLKELIGTYGSHGSGGGQFDEPSDLTINSSGEVFVLDKGNDRVEVFSSAGTYIRQFGSEGAGFGQLKDPAGIDAGGGHVWVADTGNWGVSDFKEDGTPVRRYSYPWFLTWCESIPPYIAPVLDVAADGSSVYWISGGGTVKFTPLCASESAWSPMEDRDPSAVSVDPGHNVFIVDQGHRRTQILNKEGEEVDDFGGEGQAGAFRGLTAGDNGELFTINGNDGSIQMWTEGWREPRCSTEWEQEHRTEAEEIEESEKEACDEGKIEEEETKAEFDADADNATVTVDYDVPVSGEGAPYNLSEARIAEWAQTEVPQFATAIFPPDEVPTVSTSYKRAIIYYMDGAGRVVNTVAPNGGIETNEYDSHDNLIRNLTPANRLSITMYGSMYRPEHSKMVDTQYTYSADGTMLQSVRGPLQSFGLEGSFAGEGRPYTYYEYGHSEGSSQLVTGQTEAILSGKELYDRHFTGYSYSGQSGLGWKLEQPTAEVIDPSGLHLESRTIYDSETGAIVESTKPAHPGGGTADAIRTTYYTPGENEIEECGERPEWAGLLCRTEPAAQPEAKGLSSLAIKTMTYNKYGEPVEAVETADEDTRVANVEYDDAGRSVATSVTSSQGVSQPTIGVAYDENTGIPTATYSETETLESDYNSLGQLVAYTDADGNTSTYNYDINGRLNESYDGKATRTNTYSSSGELISVEDTGIGKINAGYDEDGRLTYERLPNGLVKYLFYNSSGQVTRVQYLKSTHCSVKCWWYANLVDRSVNGKVLESRTIIDGVGIPVSAETYTYDKAGRLTGNSTAPYSGATYECSAHYGYDANTNLTAQENECWDPETEVYGGTSASHEYDEANRLVDDEPTYDAFGDITELSATDAGGHALTGTFYADGTVESLAQDGVNISYSLDPSGRQRQTVVANGEEESESVSHFMGPGETPSWISDGGEGWTRYVSGVGGGLAAIQSSGGETEIQVTNIHGDVDATVPNSEFAEGLKFLGDHTSAYGVPLKASEEVIEEGEESEQPLHKYSWLGGAQKATELRSGVISMGARVYVPEIGRFLQPDPITEGSPNSYAYTWGDPVGQYDLTGEYTPAFPAWLKDMMGHAPSMPPPPPPPAWEAEEEAEEQMLGSGGRHPGGAIALLARKNPFHVNTPQECAKHPHRKGCHVFHPPPCGSGPTMEVCPGPPKHHPSRDPECPIVMRGAIAMRDGMGCGNEIEPHDPGLPGCGPFCGGGIIERPWKP